MSKSTREPLGELVFAAAVLIVGALLSQANGFVATLGGAVVFGGVIIGLMALFRIAWTLGRPSK